MSNDQWATGNRRWVRSGNQAFWKNSGFLLLLVVALAVVLWLASRMENGEWREEIPILEPVLTFSPPGGAYDHSLLLSIRPSHPHAQVIFATGGHVPTLTVGTLYERPLLVDASVPGVTVVRAREVVNGVAGPVISTSYVVGMGDVGSTLPILSIIADPPDLWDTERGLTVNTWQRGQEWERTVHATYIENGPSSAFETLAGLRIHGSERFDEPKQSFRLYFRNDYGAARLEYPQLFVDDSVPFYQNVQSYKRLLLQAGDRSGRWTLLEKQLVSDAAVDLGRRATRGRFVLLFLNEEPWGIYRLSERIDRFFLEDNFGIRSADLIRDGDIEEGDSQHWDALMDWLATHDLADESNYAYVQTQIDVDDFTDYAILQVYFGFSADRFSAARPRVGGGRWFWLYGDSGTKLVRHEDMESSLLRLSYAGDDLDNLSLLLHRLLENPDYRAQFTGRVADLLNTTLAPAAMEARVDRLAGRLRPAIEYETVRWPTPTGGSTARLNSPKSGLAQVWERNVAALRDAVRRRPEVVRQQVAAALDLRGAASLSFGVVPDGGGAIFVNESRVPASSFDQAQGRPWNGVYFLGTDVQAIAVPAPSYVFDRWKSEPSSPHTPTLPHPHTPVLTITVDASHTLTAHFALAPEDDHILRPNDVIVNEYWINDNGTRYTTLGNRPIEGDWLELLVIRPRTIDLRGWRITDNNTKTGTREGSIILPRLDALAAVPRGTAILIVATEGDSNATYFERDDLDPGNRRMVFYVGNGNLDVTTDPGLGIGTGDDNLVLLAPGRGPAFADDIGVDFVAEGDQVTPLTFGVLTDGVVFESPFRGLGSDDGALFAGGMDNDDGLIGWIVSPPADQSGDGARLDGTNILTPGALNYRQSRPALRSGVLWLSLAMLIIVAAALGARVLRTRRG